MIIELIYVVHGKNYILHLLLQRKDFIENNQKKREIFFRSIRIAGTHNTVNKVFHLVAMEVYYIQKPFALVGDIYGIYKNTFFFVFCFID